VRMDSEEEEASYGQDSYDPSEAYEIIDDDFEQDSDSKSTSESEGSDVAARVVELPAASPRSPITPPQQAAVEEALNGGAPAVMEKVAPEESSKAAAPAVMEMVAPDESSARPAPAQAPPDERSALAVVEEEQALALTEEPDDHVDDYYDKDSRSDRESEAKDSDSLEAELPVVKPLSPIRSPPSSAAEEQAAEPEILLQTEGKPEDDDVRPGSGRNLLGIDATAAAEEFPPSESQESDEAVSVEPPAMMMDIEATPAPEGLAPSEGQYRESVVLGSAATRRLVYSTASKADPDADHEAVSREAPAPPAPARRSEAGESEHDTMAVSPMKAVPAAMAAHPGSLEEPVHTSQGEPAEATISAKPSAQFPEAPQSLTKQVNSRMAALEQDVAARDAADTAIEAAIVDVEPGSPELHPGSPELEPCSPGDEDPGLQSPEVHETLVHTEGQYRDSVVLGSTATRQLVYNTASKAVPDAEEAPVFEVAHEAERFQATPPVRSVFQNEGEAEVEDDDLPEGRPFQNEDEDEVEDEELPEGLPLFPEEDEESFSDPEDPIESSWREETLENLRRGSKPRPLSGDIFKAEPSSRRSSKRKSTKRRSSAKSTDLAHTEARPTSGGQYRSSVVLGSTATRKLLYSVASKAVPDGGKQGSRRGSKQASRRGSRSTSRRGSRQEYVETVRERYEKPSPDKQAQEPTELDKLEALEKQLQNEGVGKELAFADVEKQAEPKHHHHFEDENLEHIEIADSQVARPGDTIFDPDMPNSQMVRCKSFRSTGYVEHEEVPSEDCSAFSEEHDPNAGAQQGAGNLFTMGEAWKNVFTTGVEIMRRDSFEGKKMSPRSRMKKERQVMGRRGSLLQSEAEQFLQHLRAKGDGSVGIAWRRFFDTDGDGALSFTEFCNALVAVEYHGDAVALWRQFGGEKSSTLGLEVLDAESAMIIEFFRRWCVKTKGGPLEMFYAFDDDGSDCLQPNELADGLSETGFFEEPGLPECINTMERMLRVLYPLLDRNGRGALAPEELLFMELDPERRKRHEMAIQRRRKGIVSSMEEEDTNEALGLLRAVTMETTALGKHHWKMVKHPLLGGDIKSSSSSKRFASKMSQRSSSFGASAVSRSLSSGSTRRRTPRFLREFREAKRAATSGALHGPTGIPPPIPLLGNAGSHQDPGRSVAPSGFSASSSATLTGGALDLRAGWLPASAPAAETRTLAPAAGEQPRLRRPAPLVLRSSSAPSGVLDLREGWLPAPAQAEDQWTQSAAQGRTEQAPRPGTPAHIEGALQQGSDGVAGPEEVVGFGQPAAIASKPGGGDIGPMTAWVGTLPLRRCPKPNPAASRASAESRKSRQRHKTYGQSLVPALEGPERHRPGRCSTPSSTPPGRRRRAAHCSSEVMSSFSPHRLDHFLMNTRSRSLCEHYGVIA